MANLTAVDPRKLKNHPLSVAIYGDTVSDDLAESVAQYGVMEPPIVTADGLTIVSGHRRTLAAIRAGLPTIGVVVRDDLVDDLDIRRAVIEANVQREKTAEQRAREYTALREIEAARAEKRQQAGVDLGESFPGGRARDIAGNTVNWSGRTAEKAAAVVAAIDEAVASGDTERADRLRATLNSKSVDRAYRMTAPVPLPTCGHAMVGEHRDGGRVIVSQHDCEAGYYRFIIVGHGDVAVCCARGLIGHMVDRTVRGRIDTARVDWCDVELDAEFDGLLAELYGPVSDADQVATAQQRRD